jgi:hypothetical protein
MQEEQIGGSLSRLAQEKCMRPFLKKTESKQAEL